MIRDQRSARGKPLNPPLRRLGSDRPCRESACTPARATGHARPSPQLLLVAARVGDGGDDLSMPCRRLVDTLSVERTRGNSPEPLPGPSSDSRRRRLGTSPRQAARRSSGMMMSRVVSRSGPRGPRLATPPQAQAPVARIGRQRSWTHAESAPHSGENRQGSASGSTGARARSRRAAITPWRRRLPDQCPRERSRAPDPKRVALGIADLFLRVQATAPPVRCSAGNRQRGVRRIEERQIGRRSRPTPPEHHSPTVGLADLRLRRLIPRCGEPGERSPAADPVQSPTPLYHDPTPPSARAEASAKPRCDPRP